MKPSVFTQVINREIPAEILYEDERAIVILTIMPHHPGHSLVIPKTQIERFYDLDDDTLAHLVMLAKRLAIILQQIYQPKRVGLSIEGLSVAHVHIHLIPINQVGDMDHDRARPASPAVLAQEGDKIRKVIKREGII